MSDNTLIAIAIVAVLIFLNTCLVIFVDDKKSNNKTIENDTVYINCNDTVSRNGLTIISYDDN